jgi:formylmethanofuran dehydrogenase subunit E
MPRCFKCKTEIGDGGVVQEDGRVLCEHCDTQTNSGFNSATEAPSAQRYACAKCGQSFPAHKLRRSSGGRVFCRECMPHFFLPGRHAVQGVCRGCGIDTTDSSDAETLAKGYCVDCRRVMAEVSERSASDALRYEAEERAAQKQRDQKAKELFAKAVGLHEENRSQEAEAKEPSEEPTSKERSSEEQTSGEGNGKRCSVEREDSNMERPSITIGQRIVALIFVMVFVTNAVMPPYVEKGDDGFSEPRGAWLLTSPPPPPPPSYAGGKYVTRTVQVDWPTLVLHYVALLGIGVPAFVIFDRHPMRLLKRLWHFRKHDSQSET